MIEKYVTEQGQEIYIRLTSTAAFRAKKEEFTGLTLAAKPASGDFVALNDANHKYEAVVKAAADALASNDGVVPGRIDLKKGPAGTNWWEQATMAELAKNPTPWGDDPIVPVETHKGVLQVTLTSKMFEDWSPENPQGRDLNKSTGKYDAVAPLAIAGIRHVMNISNVHDTRQVKNSVERLLTTVALGLMIKMKYNKGVGFPFLANYGHEVRYNSQEFQDITTRLLAAMGFI